MEEPLEIWRNNTMPEYEKNRQVVKSQGGIGRREFIGAALGGVVAAGGLLSGVKKVSAAGQAAYREEIRTPIVGHYQVIVAGGGPGGFIAALAAVRSGAETLLIERYPFLGGNGTAGLMTCYNGFRNQRPPEALQTVKGIPAEYIAEIVRLGGVADADPYSRQFQHDVANGDIPYCVGYDPRE
jgi:NADPH-dependent 2,4-dienoyl-CoA reductase/sulfur reductase-like enzyme